MRQIKHIFLLECWSLTLPLWVSPKEEIQSSVQLGTALCRFTQHSHRLTPQRPRPPESSTAQACRPTDSGSYHCSQSFTSPPHGFCANHCSLLTAHSLLLLLLVASVQTTAHCFTKLLPHDCLSHSLIFHCPNMSTSRVNPCCP